MTESNFAISITSPKAYIDKMKDTFILYKYLSIKPQGCIQLFNSITTTQWPLRHCYYFTFIKNVLNC